MDNTIMLPAPRCRILVTFLVTALLAPAAAPAQIPAETPPSSDWLTYNRTFQGDRFSPLDQINTGNVAELQPVCTYDTGDTLSFQTGPVVVDGTMYFTTDTSTYAMDAATCEPIWRQGTGMPPIPLRVNRGVAFENGRLFRGAGLARVHALDAATGQLLWDVPLGDPDTGETTPMAPIAWEGMVFIGNAGGDNKGVEGHVYALNQQDGSTIWHFDVIPDTGAAAATWRNDPDSPPTGGAFWTTFGLDPEQGVLYVPAGNPAPDFFPEFRPGENLYTNSVIALDARTGEMLGYVQVVKNDYHDWDVSTGPVVLTTRGGRPLIASANKDGLLSGIDRSRVGQPQPFGPASVVPPLRTLIITYQTPITTRENMDLQLLVGLPVRFCPGTQGGSEWNGPAYHPDLNLLYVGAVDWCTTMRRTHPDSLTAEAGEAWAGGEDPDIFGVPDDTTEWRGWITAVDADSGAVRWRHETSAPMLAGVTATAGGLVLTGELTGDVIALDAETGSVLWRHPTENAIGGGVITYAVDGKQYIAVAAGMNGANWPARAESNRIIVYALP